MFQKNVLLVACTILALFAVESLFAGEYIEYKGTFILGARTEEADRLVYTVNAKIDGQDASTIPVLPGVQIEVEMNCTNFRYGVWEINFSKPDRVTRIFGVEISRKRGCSVNIPKPASIKVNAHLKFSDEISIPIEKDGQVRYLTKEGQYTVTLVPENLRSDKPTTPEQINSFRIRSACRGDAGEPAAPPDTKHANQGVKCPGDKLGTFTIRVYPVTTP